jgi:asparagine synthase (glutamine-hydrolysing)
VVEAMMAAMSHRGPDDDGIYSEPYVALGHRRLSIIDLHSGHQPLTNEDGSVVVVFNGEIYNYRELRAELSARGHTFATATDTEVIAHLYEELGEQCLERLHGMFGLAIWDVPRRRLLLARDRVGIKPLYFTVRRNSLLFASEIKALLADPSVDRTVDLQGIDRFLTFSYMPGQETLLQGIRKLPPGHYLSLEDGNFSIRQYWDLHFESDGRDRNFESATIELDELLGDSVRQHMISDVPVGVLLSGGVDSTGLLSFCREQTNANLETFTVGFSGEDFADERRYARLAAERYGSSHHEITISAEMFQSFLPKYVWHMEEPVCEPPAVALYYVARRASEQVKVLISGEGGDEAFAGYQNYRNLLWLEQLKDLGKPWSTLLGSMMRTAGHLKPFARLSKYSSLMSIPLENYYFSRSSGPYSSFNQLRNTLYTASFAAQIEHGKSLEYLHECFARVRHQTVLSQMLYVDTKTWLPDDLLVKADKMTMANSVELRVPLLDHRILEFAARLPTEYKVKGHLTKRILKAALKRRVPEAILRRSKTGFPVPIRSWIRADSMKFTRDLLLDTRTLSRGYFKRSAIESLLHRVKCSGQGVSEVFSLIVLELWHRQFADPGPCTH